MRAIIIFLSISAMVFIFSMTPAAAGEGGRLPCCYGYVYTPNLNTFDEITIDLSRHDVAKIINICLEPGECYEYRQAEVVTAIKIFNCLYREKFIQSFNYLE